MNVDTSLVESNVGNIYGRAMVKKIGDVCYFAVEDEACGTEWCRVDEKFYEAFVEEFFHDKSS